MPLGFEELSMKTPAMEYLFQLEIPGAELNPLYVSGGTFPFMAIESSNHLYKNQNKSYPVIGDLTDVTVEIYETDDNVAWNFFNEWNDLMYWKDGRGLRDGTYNVPEKYKRPIIIWRLGPTSVEEGKQVKIGVQDNSKGAPHFGTLANVAGKIPGGVNVITKVIPPLGKTDQSGVPEQPPPSAPGPIKIQQAVLNKVFGLRYIGAFPKSISDYTPRADGKDKLVFTVTFSVDDVETAKFVNPVAINNIQLVR